MRSIDADALIKKAYDEAKGMAEPYDNFGVLVEWLVDKSPTIEPERKTGKWILVTDNNGQHCVCDHCGEWKYHQRQKFCGECGAKMEEPEDIPMEYFESGGI